MKILLMALLLLMSTSCTIRYTESQIARQHGFACADRVRSAEQFEQQRCYRIGTEIHCYDLGVETDVSYMAVDDCR